MNKSIYIIIIFVFNLKIGFSQVGGLSASKLGTYCAGTIPSKQIEFEPSFSFSSSTKMFDSNGTSQNLFLSSDSIQFSSSFGFRFTYGLFDNFEVGVSLPSDISSLSVGAKYKLPLDYKMEFGLIAGYNAIVGNKVYVKRNLVNEATSSIVTGIIATYNSSEKFGFDFNAQYFKHLYKNSNDEKQGFAISSDIAYYLLRNINFISGFSYSFNNYSQLFTFNPGLAIENAQQFILVLNTPIDLFGKNNYKTKSFSLALTILLN